MSLLFEGLLTEHWYIALKWIHGSGWIHRNLGANGLYFYNGRGLVADFEYARRKNSTVSHKTRMVRNVSSCKTSSTHSISRESLTLRHAR